MCEANRNLDASLELARTAHASLPDEPNVNDTLGWIYFKKQKYDEAITALSHSVLKDPKRYDTRFFVAVAPEGQEAAPDNVEAIHHVWVNPAHAVERYRSGEYKMRTPTISTLERFAPFDTTDALIAHLRATPVAPAVLPRITPDGRRLLPGDPGYDEDAVTAVMKKPEITLKVALGLGKGRDRVLTCDLTKEYVAINGDYRS